MRRIKDLVRNAGITSMTGPADVPVENIEFDSRRAGPGTLFVAVRGTKTDGHEYINDAVKAGACAVICEKLPDLPAGNVCWITTPD